MNDDLKELLALLTSHEVEFLVIGAHAVAFHGRARYTEDVDLWASRSIENSRRLRSALREFGSDIGELGAQRFAELDRQMVRIGAPPNMVDILNFAGNDPFSEVWLRSVGGSFEGTEVRFPSRDDLLRMKKASNRPKDKADVDFLGG